jgi:putative cardiolipin synthase
MNPRGSYHGVARAEPHRIRPDAAPVHGWKTRLARTTRGSLGNAATAGRALLLAASWAAVTTPLRVSAVPGAAALIDEHTGKSGLYVLEKGEESLLARAWLVDHAERTIDIQYFIWSTDNIGTLAAEALLRAADRGVQVRVIVDDFLVDAPPESLWALAQHPRIDIRIYNPNSSVGVSFLEWAWNSITSFRAVNQRMHDKTLIVDGEVAITGGRNVADEYYDYDHEYNFRDRDLLVLGTAVPDMAENFSEFWDSPLSAPAERLLEDDSGGFGAAGPIYDGLHAYANDERNFAPEVRAVLDHLSDRFPPLLEALTWDDARFVSDAPGKNSGQSGLGGGGQTTRELASVLAAARREIVIQSPYLVMPDGGLELFERLIDRGVAISIVTNSLASTDNLQAFSGYSKQRDDLLALGVELREFNPAPAVHAALIERHAVLERSAPIFAIHAKTFVVDESVLYVGTFNLDPRSANLNTEVGVLVDNEALARDVRARILTDMAAENSWDPKSYDSDAEASFGKRVKMFLWRLLPLTPVL